jgi:hypothetical protein
MNNFSKGGFLPIFSKIFFLKQMQYIHPPPPKVWSLNLKYLVIFLIFKSDGHNQQKFQIFQKPYFSRPKILNF